MLGINNRQNQISERATYKQRTYRQLMVSPCGSIHNKGISTTSIIRNNCINIQCRNVSSKFGNLLIPNGSSKYNSFSAEFKCYYDNTTDIKVVKFENNWTKNVVVRVEYESDRNLIYKPYNNRANIKLNKDCYNKLSKIDSNIERDSIVVPYKWNSNFNSQALKFFQITNYNYKVNMYTPDDIFESEHAKPKCKYNRNYSSVDNNTDMVEFESLNLTYITKLVKYFITNKVNWSRIIQLLNEFIINE